MEKKLRLIQLIGIILILFGVTLTLADVDEFLGVSTVDEYIGVSTVDEFLGQTIGGVVYTEQFAETAAQLDTGTLGNNSSYVCVASEFTYTGATIAITKIEVELQKNNSPTMNVTAGLWSSDGGAPAVPNALIGTASDARSATTFQAGLTFEAFTGGSSSLTNGNVYFVVLTSSAVDVTNYVLTGRTSGATTLNISKSTAGCASWGQDSGFRSLRFKLYSGG